MNIFESAKLGVLGIVGAWAVTKPFDFAKSLAMVYVGYQVSQWIDKQEKIQLAQKMSMEKEAVLNV